MTSRLITPLEIQHLRASIREGGVPTSEQINSLMITAGEALAAVAESETKEIRYLIEIQRLNALVTQLVEYIETIAESAGDAPGSTSTAEEIKHRAVEMIIRSVQTMKENGNP